MSRRSAPDAWRSQGWSGWSEGVGGADRGEILLVVLDANPRNEIVDGVPTPLAGGAPFHGLFDLESGEWQVAVNWGLAAVAYYALSRVIVRLLAR